MATKKTDKADARDILESGKSSGVSSELDTLVVKSLTNLEEKVEAIDWKLWEIYNIIKSYAENPSAPQPQQPQASAADVAAEIAKALGTDSDKKSVVKKLFG
tara:strand:- start:238 stop:543 length:306 start_codon:yes stop_codon:yes gene_type:complete